MCVIILTNPKHPITEEELQQAWATNPDGAGLAYKNDNAVIFERGFMNQDYYIKKVMALQKKRPLLLHLRISTGAGVTPQGTHPYKAGNVLKMCGNTKMPVIAMNGVISGQKLKTKSGAKLNDTASYIADHDGAFKVINTDILNIIAHDTGAKWAAVTLDGIIHSCDFEEYDGRLYSNLNHLWAYDLLYNYHKDIYAYEALNIDDGYIIDTLPKKLLRTLKRDKRLYLELREYEHQHCKYYDCKYCNGCITECRSKKDVTRFLDNNLYIWDLINDGGY